MKISLVIPAYNESSIIASTVKACEEYLEKRFGDYELIIVNDGSTDGTAETVLACAGRNTRLCGYEKNRGKGCAVRTGALAAAGDIIFCTDADLAYGLEVIGTAHDALVSSESDLVIGSRRLEKGSYGKYTPLRLAASKVFGAAVRILSGMNYDTQCGFKGYRRAAAKKLFSLCVTDGFAFDFEVMMLADGLGFKTQQIPAKIINHRDSTVRVGRDAVRMLRDIMSIRRTVRNTIKEVG